jgi:hypothetical protein
MLELKGGAGIVGLNPLQLFVKFSLFFGDLGGQMDLHHHVKIPPFSVAFGKSPFRQPQLSPRLHARWDPQLHHPIQGGHFHLGAQNRFAGADGQIAVNVESL